VKTALNDVPKRFDWLAFLLRIVVIGALATWLLAERLDRHDGTGAIPAICFGYVVLPLLAYFHTRYYNSLFSAWIVEVVKRKLAGRPR
jgi:hypothetical protein